jgi:hypothetical protein
MDKNNFTFLFTGATAAVPALFIDQATTNIFVHQRGNHKFIFQERVHGTTLRNLPRYKHCESGWTVPSMIFSKWLAIWANGNTRCDAGSWPKRWAVGRQVDLTSEWRGSGGEASLSQIPGTVVYYNTE